MKTTGIRAKRNHALFMRRTYSAWKGLRKLGSDVELQVLRDMVGAKIDTLCVYCAALISWRNFSVDHAVPIDRGGDSSPGNLRIICQQSNRSKGDMTETEFNNLVRALSELDGMFPDGNIKHKVLVALRVAHSFRIGAQRRAKEKRNG